VIFAYSDLDKAVEWVMFGIFWNQGQVCLVTSQVLVERAIYELLIARRAAAAARIPNRRGCRARRQAEAADLGGSARQGAGRHHRGTTLRRAPGVRRRAAGPRQHRKFLQPTIFADTPVDSALWRDEVFGPVVALRPFDDEPEAGSGSV